MVIGVNKDESLNHIENDYKILLNVEIEKLIKPNFIPWLKRNEVKS